MTNQASEVERNSPNKSDEDVKLDDLLLEASTHYERVCLNCGYTWLGLHCPHDGYQNPCGHCREKPKTVETTKDTTCECNGATDLVELKTEIQDLIRNEKLKLLDEVRERVIGENDRGTITDPDSPSYGEPYESTTADKEELRAELTKLEAEL